MNRNHIKAAVLGGLIVFIWGILSWMVFPWHQHCFKKFSNESRVARAISDNTCEKGVYVLPNTFGYNDSTSQKEMARGEEMMEKGPYMMAVVHPNGMGKMTLAPFALSLVCQIIGALIVTWMLLCGKVMSFRRKVAFVTLFGLAVGILGELPYWIWWGFPLSFAIVGIIDLIIGWFLAGLCIAKVLKK